MRFLSFLVLLFSLNCFAVDGPNEVTFSNGARLLVHKGKSPKLFYFSPTTPEDSDPAFDIGMPILPVNASEIEIVPGHSVKTPDQIVEMQFKGNAPKFWPVIVTDEHQIKTRYYVSESGESLVVAVQGRREITGRTAFEIPLKWQIHKVIYEKEQYLVVVEERAPHSITFLYLRLRDGAVAIHEGVSTGISREYFGETTGAIFREWNEGLKILAPDKLDFKDPTNHGQDNYWFPNLEEAKNLQLPPIDPSVDPKEEEVSQTEEKTVASDPRAEFAAYMAFINLEKGKPQLKPLLQFKNSRYTLVDLKNENSFGVFDTWRAEVIQRIPRQHEKYLVINNSEEKSQTFTVRYPDTEEEVLYSQPTVEKNLEVRQIKRSFPKGLEKCALELDQKFLEMEKLSKMSK